MPFFSVLIPTRDRAFLLKNAVASILAQDFQDFEIVIGDNSSNDATRDYFSGLSDGRIRYHRAPKFLLGDENMQFVYSHAAGDYFIVMGDDDYLVPGALDEVARVIRARNSQLLAFGLVTYYDRTYYEPAKRNTLHYREFSGKVLEFSFEQVVSAYFNMAGTAYYPPHPSATVFSKKVADEVAERHGAFYLPIYADIISVPLAIARTKKLDFIDKPLVVIGRGSESQVAKEVHNPDKMWEHIAVSFDNVPFKGRFSNNALAESIVRLKKYEPETFRRFDLNMANYCSAYYQGMVDSRSAGNNVAAQAAEFYSEARRFRDVPLLKLLKIVLKVNAAAFMKKALTKLRLLGPAANFLGLRGKFVLSCDSAGLSSIEGCAAKLSGLSDAKLKKLDLGGGSSLDSRLVEVVILAVGRALMALSTIFTIRVMTALLTPAEIGRLNIILSVGGGFLLILISPVGLYMTRRLISWQRNRQAWASLKKFGAFLLGVAALNALVAAGYHRFIGIDIGIWWLVLLVSSSILFSAGNSSFSSVINMLGHRGIFVTASVSTVLVGLLLSATFVIRLGSTAEYWLAGQLFAQAVVLLLVLRYLRNCFRDESAVHGESAGDFNFKAIFPFAWPLSIGVIFYWLQTQGYRFAVESKYGVESLGHFAVGFGIGTSIMQAFEAVFNQFYLPIFYREISGVDDAEKTLVWNRYAAAFIPFIIITAAFAASNSRIIGRILVPTGYEGIEYVLVIGVVAESIRLVVTLLSMVSHAKYEMSPLILPGMVGALVAVGGIIAAPAGLPVEFVGLFLASGWLISLTILYFRMRSLLDIALPVKRSMAALLFSAPFFVFWYLGGIEGLTRSGWLSWGLLSVAGVYLLALYSTSSQPMRGLFEKIRRTNLAFLNGIFSGGPQ